MTKMTRQAAVQISYIEGDFVESVRRQSCYIFHEVELLVRNIFNKESLQVTELTCNLKQKVIESSLTDENIQFHWCLISTDIEDDKATILLKMIIELYVTIRGFSFVVSFMELNLHRNLNH